jgi:hypothetical protein
MSRKEAFEAIERERRWGEQKSGPGSTLDATRIPREIIARIVADYRITSILDAPCGDFGWMSLLLPQLPVQYVGVDIVPTLIAANSTAFPQYAFRRADFVSDPLPQAQLILCRDALQHLPVRDIKAALQNFSRSGAEYLLTSTHLRRYGLRNWQHCPAGRCRDRNLLLPPFSLPDPIVIYAEQGSEHKYLALWRLPFQSDQR